jgi:hypothetical protein
MKRTLLFIGVGLVSSVLFIPAMLGLTTATGHEVFARIVFGPANFLQRNVLPRGTYIWLSGRDTQGSFLQSFILLMLAFWWTMFSVLFWILHRVVMRSRHETRRPASG